ncbi:acetyl-CoA carboxylase biotin carboxyl carrier protein [Bacillus sp. FJAT-29937]|uniref:acetyl-CoA carboxylase biotin carboxyl carrier protein n=1 Tax=Bacillus sp. FJAT-29937 TaxID=1720553 RepID=UPI0008304378|nr:acetyl-CoA carboxylase biotin carboxyl carrier protein [Bacillus sp. FJAT-29937]
MKTDELKELMGIIEQSSIDVLKLEKGDFKLYYQKQGAENISANIENRKAVEDTQALLEAAEKKTESPAAVKEESGLHVIQAPMIGTFYARPNPEAEPFVQVGSIVAENEPVCILEAMKLLNEVPAGVNGEIIEILVEDGQIIEYGQPLFTVKVSE